MDIQLSKCNDFKKVLDDILDNSDFYEDISFLVPQILNYYGVIGDEAAIIPYATVGIILDSTKLIRNIADIINSEENIKKLNDIKRDFENNAKEQQLRKEIYKIQRKNEKKAIKNSMLNFTRAVGDVLCFSFGTWLYGESIKISSTVTEILIEWQKHLKQKGRDIAKEKGGKSLYAKIFNMEKSTDSKIKKKHEIVKLVNEEFYNYINTSDYDLKNKRFEKLDLYVRILSRYKKSFGVKKDWDRILDKQLKCKRNKVTKSNHTSVTANKVSFKPSVVDAWQFQRFVLMIEFVNDIKKSINNISNKYTIKGKLKHIKQDIKDKKCETLPNEGELLKFLIAHNKRSLKDVAYRMTILGSNIVGEMGELVSYFKETVFRVIGMSVKLFGTVLGQGVRIEKKVLKRNKKVTKNANIMLNIITTVSNLNLEYETFFQYMIRLNVYLDEVGLTWKDVSNKEESELRNILEEALM